MAKIIIKEIIILLLLLLAIILALGVLFYDYIPTNKTVPSVATYTTSETVKNELNSKIIEEEAVLVTYEITSGDLSNYAKTNQYKKGKVNPFSTYQQQPDEEQEGSPEGTTKPGSTTGESTGNHYYGDKGTK